MNKKDQEKPHVKALGANDAAQEEDLWDLDEQYKASELQNQHPAQRREPPQSTKIKPDSPTKSLKGKDTATSLTEKKSISLIEKLALASFFMMLLCGGGFTYLWLYKQNKRSEIKYDIELPVTGSHAVIANFSTFWQSAKDLPHVKQGVVMVPSAELKLSKKSTSGVLRVYFYDHNDNIVGDPVTISFKNGKFENGQHSTMVTATDGLSNKNDFIAYQMEKNIVWQVDIREAENRNVKGHDFQILTTAKISPIWETSAE